MQIKKENSQRKIQIADGKLYSVRTLSSGQMDRAGCVDHRDASSALSVMVRINASDCAAR